MPPETRVISPPCGVLHGRGRVWELTCRAGGHCRPARRRDQDRPLGALHQRPCRHPRHLPGRHRLPAHRGAGPHSAGCDLIRPSGPASMSPGLPPENGGLHPRSGGRARLPYLHRRSQDVTEPAKGKTTFGGLRQCWRSLHRRRPLPSLPVIPLDRQRGTMRAHAVDFSVPRSQTAPRRHRSDRSLSILLVMQVCGVELESMVNVAVANESLSLDVLRLLVLSSVLIGR